ncbi:DUF5714 domain-containing protein [Carboxydocella sp. JDF658]|uniref:DUF5714 domain-containing protein n=1 Tax=Carboxydocella sp. JDF658 TaxID=1926600 RepID=UPI0009AEEA06|nr:DUF5714 domain-containing protein [Carboxydocella sp. JDF658]GAW30866.1 hypothetical protein JDF658_06310 [Carboxydocella sp. JDF658]
MQRDACFVCGQPLIYNDQTVEQTCVFCGEKEMNAITCPNGHYLCNRCHGLDALGVIRETTLKSSETVPEILAEFLMQHPTVAMHGPEHHALVPAVLVAVTANLLGLEEKEALVKEAIKRGSRVPGGHCGYFGACGAGVGVGIAVSVLTGATPLKREEWSWANRATAMALEKMADTGGPRCCKRCTLLALAAGREAIARFLQVELPAAADWKCRYFSRNRQCLGRQCPFWGDK